MAELQFREALRSALREEMLKDERIFIMGEEVAEYNGAYKVTEGLLTEFGPERVIDTPIAELGFAGIGVGAAMAGQRPVVEFMTWNFALLAIDAIINSAAKMRHMSAGQFGCPIVFRGPTGNAGQLGQQHSQNFENWYANTPGLKVVVPSTPRTAKGLLKAAIRDENPVIFMESELMYGMKGEVPDVEDYTLPIGKAEIARAGKDITLITFGKMYHTVLEAARELEKQGIDAEVIDLLSVRPIDYDTILQSVRKTNRALVIEEAWPLGSISSELAYQIQRHAFDHLDAPVLRVTNRDTPLAYAPTLLEECLPNPERIIRATRASLYLD
ncbi:MAG: pyruvate dehydrogenase complex E1 component subunit beta [Sphingobacteriia bacterium]|jgi:pyruvate dehydrogenase E1 component beta subunit